jgi:four helix bundle protein
MTEKTPKLQPTGLRNLRAFLLAKTLSHNIYDLTAEFPKHEFRLVGQMRGAAVSVFGNIAEGYGRNSIGDYIRFCEIARGSLAELGSYLEFCQERHFLKPDDEDELFSQYNHAWNTLGALIRSLKDKRADTSWDNTYNVVKEELQTYDF